MNSNPSPLAQTTPYVSNDHMTKTNKTSLEIIFFKKNNKKRYLNFKQKSDAN